MVTEAPKIQDRLTVVEKVYHQQHGEQPIQIERSFERMLQTQDAPYNGHPRRTISEEWTPLDFGWLEDGGVSVAYVINDEGKNLKTMPTAEEKAAIAAKVLEIANVVDLLDIDGTTKSTPVGMIITIPPGETRLLSLDNFDPIRVRCRSGVARVSIWLFPR